MEKQVIYIDIAELAIHPINVEIYGEVAIDEMLVQSIKEHGIREPLHIFETLNFYPEINEKYTVVSGHRRLAHAIVAGLVEVPCIIEYYPDQDTIELDLLLFNQQRVKNPRTIEREYSTLNQKLCQIANYKKKHSLNFDPANLDETFRKCLRNLGIDVENVFVKDEILSRHFGLSRPSLDKLLFVFSDDLLNFFVDELYSIGAKNDEITALSMEFEDVRRGVDSEIYTINAAHNRLVEKVSELAKVHKYELKGKKLYPLAKSEPKPKTSSTKKTKKQPKGDNIGISVRNSDGKVTSMSFLSSVDAEITFSQAGTILGSLDLPSFLTIIKEALYDNN